MIRPAKMDDADALWDLALRMHAESNYLELEPSEVMFRKFVSAMIGLNGEQARILVAERDSKLIGFHIGYIANPFWSMDRIGHDAMMYIDQDHRGGMTAMRLIKAFEDWAVQQGAKQIRPGISVGGPIDRVARLYHAAGYQTAGYSFVKNV